MHQGVQKLFKLFVLTQRILTHADDLLRLNNPARLSCKPWGKLEGVTKRGHCRVAAVDKTVPDYTLDLVRDQVLAPTLHTVGNGSC